VLPGPGEILTAEDLNGCCLEHWPPAGEKHDVILWSIFPDEEEEVLRSEFGNSD